MGLFELRSACTHYNGRTVLRDVSLSIEAGERVALVGKSGAGKTTLLKLLYQQRKPDCALVPQNSGLVKSLSVFHNVYIGTIHKHPTWYNLLNLAHPLSCEVTQVRAILERLALEEKLFTPVGELSGGEQQRIAIARGLLRGAPILIGDEPVSALDSAQSHNVLKAISESHRTVLVAMHDVDLALTYTDRVIGIKDGRLAVDKKIQGLRSSDLDFLYQS